MRIDKKTSFIETYFDNKSGDELKKTITPNWGKETLNRHLEIVSVPKNAKTILEVGCGIGRLLKGIYDNGATHCVGVDASEAMLIDGVAYVGDRNIDFFSCDGSGDINRLNDNYFDFSFSIITFQHIPNTETVKKYISEMVRVTKPGGEVVFQVLSEDLDKGFLWSYHDVDKLVDQLNMEDIKHCHIKNDNRWMVFRCKV